MIKNFDINKFNLDKILWFFLGEGIFTDINDIEYNRKSIDVRSHEEHLSSPILRYNVPVINKAQHDFLHRYLILAFAVILYGFFQNRRYIKHQLLKISRNKKDKLLIACSKGRLRSPIIWIYARFLGIDCKILKNGIKPLTLNNKNFVLAQKKISGD